MGDRHPARWLVVLALVTAGCELRATQLVVRVDTDLMAETELERIEIAVTDPGLDAGASPEFRTVHVKAMALDGDQVVLPFSFGVRPRGGDPSREARIELRGFVASAEQPIIARARAAFAENQALLLPMFLWRRCQGILCPPGQTCEPEGSDASCVTERRVGVPIEPGTELEVPLDGAPSMDGGAADGGAPGPIGVLDESFGDGGSVTYDYVDGVGSSISERAEAVDVDSVGRIVVVGSGHFYPPMDGDVGRMATISMRLLEDGRFDPAYQYGPRSTPGITVNDDEIFSHGSALLLHGRDDVVVCGHRDVGRGGDDPILFRHLGTNGDPDPSFDTDGEVHIDIIGDTQCNGFAFDATDDTYVVASHQFRARWPNLITLARVHADDGSRVMTFGTGSLVTYDDGGIGKRVRGTLVDDLGRILVVADTESRASDVHIFVLRFLGDGTLDTSFSADGVFRYDTGVNDVARALALDSAGRILVTGRTGTTMLVLRLDPSTGELDTSFAADGVYTFDGSSIGLSLVANDSAIYVAGNVGRSMGLWKLTHEGVLDGSFGGMGVSGTPGLFLTEPAVDGSDLGFDLALDHEGRALVVGEVHDESGHSDFAIWRIR